MGNVEREHAARRCKTRGCLQTIERHGRSSPTPRAEMNHIYQPRPVFKVEHAVCCVCAAKRHAREQAGRVPQWEGVMQ